MFRGGAELAVMVHKLFVIVGIGDAMKIATVNGFGFIMFGNGDGFETFAAGGDVNVAAHEIHEIGAL